MELADDCDLLSAGFILFNAYWLTVQFCNCKIIKQPYNQAITYFS